MKEIELPGFIITEKKDNFATFVIEPLYSGYGVTLGNSLRRVLLSSLPGAAVTAMKVEGVSHEFSVLPHLKEDLVQIVLNLKRLRVRLHSEEPVFLKLEAKKPGKVTAGDISKDARVEIVNHELVIANLDKEGKLSMEIRVENGLGYIPVEDREPEKELGLIAIDALFSPVSHVFYEVVNTRVGEATDYDKLILSVTTDGTLSPEEALKQAGEILVKHFEIVVRQEISKPKAKTALPRAAAFEEISVEELGLSTRATNALINNEIKTVSDIVKFKKDLPHLKGLGAKALEEIMEKLKEIGLPIEPKVEEEMVFPVKEAKPEKPKKEAKKAVKPAVKKPAKPAKKPAKPKNKSKK